MRPEKHVCMSEDDSQLKQQQAHGTLLLQLEQLPHKPLVVSIQNTVM